MCADVALASSCAADHYVKLEVIIAQHFLRVELHISAPSPHADGIGEGLGVGDAEAGAGAANSPGRGHAACHLLR